MLPGRKPLRLALVGGATAALLVGCSTPQALSPAQLAYLGVREGVPHWEATSALFRQGNACFGSGVKRDDFECTKTVGGFPTCVLRVGFTVGDQNTLVSTRIAEPACMGTP
jgi:hypothetical protein